MTSSTPSKPPKASTRKLNRALGTLVPSLLLAYVGFAYKIVVLEYCYAHIWAQVKQGRRTLGVITPAWFVAIHLLFVATIKAYFNVLTASSRAPSPPRDPPPVVLEKRVIHECDADGQPLRCCRDECGGRWKPPRTRHCGTCKKCTPGLDHHCVWFNADIASPTSMRGFLCTTALAPCLIFAALGPLTPIAWAHARQIWRFARSSEEMERLWWRHRWTWVGGPWTRYGWGFLLGAWIYPQDQSVINTSRSLWIEHPSAGVVLLIILGLIIASVCAGMLASTLGMVSRADLTIDVARRKLATRALAGASVSSLAALKEDTYTQPSSRSIASIPALGTQFFSVPVKTPEGFRAVVVRCSLQEQPYASDDWVWNLKTMLGLSPYDGDRTQTWPISKEWRLELERRAMEIEQQGQCGQ